MPSAARVFLTMAALVTCVYAASPLPEARPEQVGLSSERLRRVHSFIDGYIQRRELTGAVTVVARRGKLALFEAQGFSDLEARRPQRTDDIFRIASMTKPMATIGALMLLEESRFLLDDPVSKFLPEFRGLKVAVPQQAEPDGYRLVPAEREITVHDLFTHRSGLTTRPGSKPAASLAEMVRNLVARPLDFQPGSAWEYGPSTDVLGYLVEVLSGQSLEDYLKSRIFAPLGMQDTSFRLAQEKASRLTPLYRRVQGQGIEKITAPFDVSAPRYFSAGGGLVSTPGDYLRFCQMLLNGGELDGKRLVSPKTIELMTERHWSPIPIGFLRGQYFGLGVAVKEADGASGMLGSAGAYGWSGAYNTYFRIDPKEQLVLILFVQVLPSNDISLQHGFHNAVMQSITQSLEMAAAAHP